MELLSKYFKNLPAEQVEKLANLQPLYEEWNAKINVISRKNMDEFMVNHLLHSLAIAKVISFEPNTKILDVGTGGGFPGVPLAILFPNCKFHLVDSIGKKIKVVEEVCSALKLTNVVAEHARVEELNQKYHFVVSRAVTRATNIVNWVGNKFEKESVNELKNGYLFLKGGDLEEELLELNKPHRTFYLSNYFKEPFFETKQVIYFKNYRK